MYLKLRPHEAGWIQHNGQPVLFIRERTGLSDRALVLPPALAPVLNLCDGTRDVDTLRTSFIFRTGIDLSLQMVEQIVGQLDEALLLESPKAAAAYEAALEAYRSAPFRTPALAGKAYPADADALRQELDGLVGAESNQARNSRTGSEGVRGVISPHIDYKRGGPVYARVWHEARQAVCEAEVAIVFGTDHAGGFGKLTLTRQNYSTPWGGLTTHTGLVDDLAEAIGPEDAFEEELNHRSEHSIELALVWLHYALNGNSCKIVPILCGSFHQFVSGDKDPVTDRRIEKALGILRNATAGKRAVIVAAADLAHVGPAFGDPRPLGTVEKELTSSADKLLLDAIERGNAGEFLNILRDEGDQRRVCGLPPIYMTLRLLEESQGYTVDYAQCPADADGGSLVSIAGVVLR